MKQDSQSLTPEGLLEEFCMPQHSSLTHSKPLVRKTSFRKFFNCIKAS